MRSRAAWASAGAALALLLLSGCTVSPEPSEPTPTFANEAEAFAAAEATYRAYVDALNDVDLSDPETFEAVYAWTTGDANAGARETFSQMHADGWQVEGPTIIALVRPSARQLSGDVLTLDVCLDVSQVVVVDAQGESVVQADRRDIQSMLVTLQPASVTQTGLAISAIEGREGEPSCDG